jgi:hypothetical protein
MMLRVHRAGVDEMTPIDQQSPTPPDDASRTARRRPWTRPTVQDLPKLTDLTLISSPPIIGGGGTGGGGSTVF